MPDLPSRQPGAAPWSPDHLRLHRLLRRQPQLLPSGACLLVAVSGGQDSMALVALLRDLRRLHGWTLHLWHGDHRWRSESSDQAGELKEWATGQGLPLTLERWEPPQPAIGEAGANRSEAAARQWRYGQLTSAALSLGAVRVVTGHTGSDRAETLLLNLVRGSHRRGLGSLRELRPLRGALRLARPMLLFSRADTARLCDRLHLPVWADASNSDLRYSRNRLRQEVLPVLEALHPGAERRLASLAGQRAGEDDAHRELVGLALNSLRADPPARAAAEGERAGSGPPPPVASLPLRTLRLLQRANQAALVQEWLERHTGRRLSRRSLESLLDRLGSGRNVGAIHLADGWLLRWEPSRLVLTTCA